MIHCTPRKIRQNDIKELKPTPQYLKTQEFIEPSWPLAIFEPTKDMQKKQS